MKRPGFILWCVVLSLSFGCEKDSKPSRPNIILILADDLGWADLGCYGNMYHETPHLDRLAGKSLRFTDAYATCPVCSPTRASILTGKYPATLNLTDWIPGRQNRKGVQPTDVLVPPNFEQQLNLEEFTLAEALKQQGYVTANIGKWHLGDTAHYPTHQGFDLNITGNHYGFPANYFYPYRNHWRKNYTFDDLIKEGQEGEYLTDRLNEEAIKFIGKNKNKPFFLYLPHYAVHTPLVSKDGLFNYFTGKEQKVPESTFTNPRYAGMLKSLDEGVGSILDYLDNEGLTQNTIIIFTSDNGGLSVQEAKYTPSTSNAPLRQGKGYLGEGGIRVPLIIHWPGATRPGITEQVVNSNDLLPTILEGLQISFNEYKIDGKSFLQHLQPGEKLAERSIFWHYPHYSNQGGKPSGAVRQGDFKLIEYYEDESLELFNLKEDPSESNNLAEQMPGKVKELHQLLQTWRDQTNAQMPSPNPMYDPSLVSTKK